MSDFSEFWQDAGPVMDTVFGEPLMVIPMTSGPYEAATLDTSRPSYTATGIIDERPIISRNEGRGRFDADQADRLAMTSTIDFTLRDLREIMAVAGATELPRVGDKFSAVERLPLETWEIVWPGPSGQGRITYHVTKVKT